MENTLYIVLTALSPKRWYVREGNLDIGKVKNIFKTLPEFC